MLLTFIKVRRFIIKDSHKLVFSWLFVNKLKNAQIIQAIKKCKRGKSTYENRILNKDWNLHLLAICQRKLSSWIRIFTDLCVFLPYAGFEQRS